MERITNPSSGSHRRNGLSYKVTPEEIEQYKNLGYIVLNDVLTEEELTTIDPWFDHLHSDHFLK